MTETSRKSGADAGRDKKGRFTTGNPGKPKGTLNKATRKARALLQGEAELLTRQCIDMAIGGDATAMRLCMERLVPAFKTEQLAVQVPGMDEAAGLSNKALAALSAAAGGDVSIDAASRLVAAIASVAKVVEIDELIERIEKLEAKNGSNRA